MTKKPLVVVTDDGKVWMYDLDEAEWIEMVRNTVPDQPAYNFSPYVYERPEEEFTRYISSTGDSDWRTMGGISSSDLNTLCDVIFQTQSNRD